MQFNHQILTVHILVCRSNYLVPLFPHLPYISSYPCVHISPHMYVKYSSLAGAYRETQERGARLRGGEY